MIRHKTPPHRTLLRAGLPALFLSLFFISIPSTTFAYRCAGDIRVFKEFEKMSWIFLGRVSGYDERYMYPTINPDVSRRFPNSHRNLGKILKKHPELKKEYHGINFGKKIKIPIFEVIKTWKGPVNLIAKIYPSLGPYGEEAGSSLKFDKNNTYLVYAYEGKFGYTTNACRRGGLDKKNSGIEMILLDALEGTVSYSEALNRILSKYRNSSDALTRKHAVEALVGFPPDEIPEKVLSYLEKGLEDPDEKIREATLAALRRIYEKDRKIVSYVMAAANDPSPRVRFRVIASLSHLAYVFPDRRKEIARGLEQILKYENERARGKNRSSEDDSPERNIRLLLEVLAKYGNREQVKLVIPYITDGLKSKKDSNRSQAVSYTSFMNTPFPELLPILKKYTDRTKKENLEYSRYWIRLDRVITYWELELSAPWKTKSEWEKAYRFILEEFQEGGQERAVRVLRKGGPEGRKVLPELKRLLKIYGLEPHVREELKAIISDLENPPAK